MTEKDEAATTSIFAIFGGLLVGCFLCFQLRYLVDVTNRGPGLCKGAPVLGGLALGGLFRRTRLAATLTMALSIAVAEEPVLRAAERSSSLAAISAKQIRLSSETRTFRVAATSPGALTPTLPPVVGAVAPTAPAAVEGLAYPTVTPTPQTVSACGDIQTAINKAARPAIIKIVHTLDCTGTWNLPQKPGTEWVIITTDDATLPTSGTRVTIANDATKMPKLRQVNGDNPVLTTSASAAYYRIVGIDLRAWTDGTTYATTSISGGSSVATRPNHIILDRVLIRGPGNTHNSRRGVYLSGLHLAVLDSSITDYWDTGTDSQAIWINSGPGPYHVENNLLTAASENILTGGSDVSGVDMLPQDITIKRNQLEKPLSWKGDDPSWDGINRGAIKNNLEVKLGIRVLIEGNVVRRIWPAGQSGWPVLFTVRNQDGTNPYAEISDVTFRKNKIHDVCSGINILGKDYAHLSQSSKRILIEHNLFYDMDATAWGCGGGGLTFMVQGETSDLRIEHNTTAMPVGNNRGAFMLIGVGRNFLSRLTIMDNLNPGDASNGLGLWQDQDGGYGTTALNDSAPGWTFTKNAIWNIAGFSGQYPAGNYFPANAGAVGFRDHANDDYHLTAGSAYRNAGTDGKDLGADIDAVNAATSGVEQ